jgi:hypothetical protein
VDFVQKDVQGKIDHIDILRNHSYNVKITKVKGRGYDTAEEAFNAQPANIEVEEQVIAGYPEQHNGWAGSNIYFDGEKLTFDDANVYTHSNYQGVFFKWGSLWGIDPSGNNNSSWSNKFVYKPDGTIESGYSWASIPCVSDDALVADPPPGKTNNDWNYLLEIHDPANGIGDICKYLTDKGWAPGSPARKWRMPTAAEFNAFSTLYYYRVGTWSSQTSDNAQGRYDNPNAPYLIFYNSGGLPPPTPAQNAGLPIFPAAGNRRASTGQLNEVGNIVHYWCGSPMGTLGGELYVDDWLFMQLNNAASRANSFPVRCVME